MTATATMTSKNQITVPSAIKEELSLEKGDKIVFLLDKRTRKVEFIRANEMIDNLAGILSDKVPNKLKTVPINEAIEKGKIFYYEKIYKE